jgi:pyruvate dehydrogenase E1 component
LSGDTGSVIMSANAHHESFPSDEPGPADTLADSDPEETQEWLGALEGLIDHAGPQRAAYLLRQLESRAQQHGVSIRGGMHSPYQNTIPLERQIPYPGDIALEERITALVRWNALAMVVRANKAYGELGGHIASYASAAEIFEVGFNHFFRGNAAKDGGDLVFFQPHSAPGVYARAFLEGRLTQAHLTNYRQEVNGGGLCSYCHPWLMPQFWQFPTGSMGLGPITSIYQARFMRYLEHRKLATMGDRHVWGVFGDGEMDEPESVAALTLAARERLDNLTFVINCNLQRLDGPVRGNGKIIQELEALFRGAGWNVIKVLWGSDWDPLFSRDRNHALLRRLGETVDGQYQTLGANNGAYNQSHFFELDPELQMLVAHMSQDEIHHLKRGGHDYRKLYAAFAAARDHRGQPTVILAKTKKGYGMGRVGESRMTGHQEKKLDVAALIEFRDRFKLPLSDEEVAQLRFIRPEESSPEIAYLKSRRARLGGPVPKRRTECGKIPIPALDAYASFALNADGKELSTTMGAIRLLTNLLRAKGLGQRIVPIVADEARTFGMASLFRQIGIYSPLGQLYEPEDAGSLLSYRESREGQLLEEGITEAGALSSWIAAATAYSVYGVAMLPVYIFYSMFGFQRVGDLIWAAADQRARGFLVGATSGRTTLGGEGLQHQDGSSQLIAGTVPNCRAYDPGFAYELAVIVDHGMRRMCEEEVDEFYYLTVTNESYAQPSLPAGSAQGIIKGLYRIGPQRDAAPSLRLLGSGAILREALAASDLLWRDWGISSEVWSATSFTELARDAREASRWNRLHPREPARCSYVADCLPGDAPIIAATDYVCAYAQAIAPYVSAPFVALGTDGFGRSDTRPALRRFFEVDRYSILVTSLHTLALDNQVAMETVAAALAKYSIDSDTAPPWTR